MANGYNPDKIWQPNGRAFSQGVVQHDGHIIHITGQVAWDQDGNIVGKGNVRTQMEKSINNIQIILESVGGRLDDIVSMTIYFTNREHISVIQEVRSKYFSFLYPPTSVLIQAGLVHPDLLVELVPIAVVPYQNFKAPPQ